MKQTDLLLIGGLILALVVLCSCMMKKGSREEMSGFGVITSIGLYNRKRYCDPGWDYPGAAYSGGCFLPHRVII